MPPSTKTPAILNRLPDFYDTRNPESLLYQMVDVFAHLLQETETDLFRVMRSHFVDTADNEGSQGLVSAQQGDLDKLFSLYLETLGLTSQLSQVTPTFHPGAFKNLQGLIRILQLSQVPIAKTLLQNFSPENRTAIASLSIPLSETDLLQGEAILIEELNQVLHNPGLQQCYLEHFSAASLTPETQRLLQQKPPKGRPLTTLNRALLEAAFPNEIEKSYAPYRDRLKALIRVLRRGAATKDGIRDIVAANLGIFGDDAPSLAAKQLIQLEEFLPELIPDEFQIHPHTRPPAASESITFQYEHTFLIHNPNVIPTRPGFQLQVLDVRPNKTADTPPLQPLINPRIVNAATLEAFEFQGMLQVNEVLRVTPEGDLYRNGEPIPSQKLPPPLPRDTSQWYIEAQVGELAGRLDQTLFNLSRFDRARDDATPLTPQQASNYAIALRVELIRQTPASFRVRVPWDIPGYTDKFSDDGDHPRSQIPDIINKVKAAGILAVIAYEKRWQETHQHRAQLTVERSPFTENQNMEELNFDIGSSQKAYPGGIPHEMTDTFITSGMFDYTAFDTDNRFT